ncbi:MAG: cob(I)yrinic acid a,c-diamide adenosyltransferase [Cyanobacteria bacterium P01_F01_bin.42]
MVTSEVPSLLDLEGMIQIFTAPHRSFFTNVVAQAIRTAAQGKSTLLIQFLKGGIGTGKDRPVQLCQHLTWIRCPLAQCVQSSEVGLEDRDKILELWDFAKASILSDEYSTVILDELSLAMELNLIPEADCLTLLEDRPKRLDLILTGPNMPDAILNAADQVTELRRSLYI